MDAAAARAALGTELPAVLVRAFGHTSADVRKEVRPPSFFLLWCCLHGALSGVSPHSPQSGVQGFKGFTLNPRTLNTP